jgi:FGGY-family pentulose kinase
MSRGNACVLALSTNRAMYTIGVDVGTGSVRAGLFDLSGKRLAMAVEPIRIHTPQPEHAEQSSADIWRAVGITVRHVVQEAGVAPESIIGIGYDATCSLVVLGQNAQPLTISPSGDPQWNVMMWMDHRAIREAEEINAGHYDVLRYVGGVISPEMETPKLLWLKRHMPETYRQATKFFDLPDYLVYRSTGVDVRSLCTTVCKWTYLGHEDRWDMNYLNAIGIADMLEGGRAGSTIRPQGEQVGTLTPEAAEHLGLTTRTQVAVAIIDAHAGALGLLGAVWHHQPHADIASLERAMALIGGTSACLMAVSQEERFVPGVWGPYYSALMPGMWLHEGGQSAAGALIDYTLENNAQRDWLKAEAQAQDITVYELANRIIDRIQSDAPFRAALTCNLHVYPDHYGNRSPYGDPHSRGVVDGLSLDSSPEATALLYYASLQGLAYNIRDVLKALGEQGYRIDQIYATGGSIKNRLWLQEHADATGCKIVLNQEPEAVLLGSAILGAVASGAYSDLPTAMKAMDHPGQVVEPNPETFDYHDRKFEIFREMYQQHLDRRKRMNGV